MIIEQDRKPKDLLPAIEHLFELSASKIIDIEKTWNPQRGAPVFTIKGKYTTRGWTDWTQGFLFGSAILQYDATGKKAFLDIGRKGTMEHMATHVSHIGVHDHGFNNYSTYGNLLRLMNENRIPENEWERNFYSLAIKISGAVQASRWTELPEDLGYIYSFNGPHSLFSDTIRTLRVLALSHQLGHHLMGESDFMLKRQPGLIFILERVEIIMMFLAGWFMSPYLIRKMAATAIPVHSRVILRLPHGHAGWHGLFLDLQSSSNI
jgi:hypothetical protein